MNNTQRSKTKRPFFGILIVKRILKTISLNLILKISYKNYYTNKQNKKRGHIFKEKAKSIMNH